MVICCYTHIDREWTERELRDRLSLLPKQLHDEVLRKQQWRDRQLSVAGKLLLKEVLNKMGIPQLSLSDLKYNIHKRPYIDAGLDFNIAHSGNIAICCATDSGKTGIDVEEMKEIDLGDYTEHFTPNEWGIISSYPDHFAGFFKFWTRKEAVLKAIGTGFHTPLSSVDVSADTIVYDGIEYHLQKLNIDAGYKCYIATTEKTDDIQVFSVEM